VEILTQMRAVRAAIKRAEEQILREHLEHCVADTIQTGNRNESRTKIQELLEILTRFSS